MRLSIKESPRGKPTKYLPHLAQNWKAVDFSLSDLLAHISSGKPVVVSHLQDGYRKKANFLCSSVAFLDIDESATTGLPLTDDELGAVLAWAKSAQVAAIVPSASDKPNAHKLRVIFALDEIITDSAFYSDLIRFIAQQTSDQTPALVDKAATDQTRMFYGSTPGAMPYYVDNNAVLNVAPLREKIERRKAEQAQHKNDFKAHTGKHAKNWTGALPTAFVETVEAALNAVHKDDEWSKLIPCPIVGHEHDDHHPAAQWNFDKHFVYCHKCAQTYPAKQVGEALGIHLRDYLPKKQKKALSDRVKVYSPTSFTADLTLRARFVSDVLYLVGAKGTYLIRSATGTGKTELAKRIVKAQRDRALVITHRQTLARDVAKRYGIPCYLDYPNLRGFSGTVCINSLHKIDTDTLTSYKVVIIDELTQVLRHLNGSTLTGAEAIRAKKLLEMVIKNAELVLTFDASMNDPAAEWARSIRPDVITIDNQHHQDKGSCTFYAHPFRLLQEAITKAENGEKIAIATSKAEVERLGHFFEDRDKRVFAINSNNSDTKAVQAAIEHINDDFWDVLVYSPSLGSGVDITQPVSAVFGYFRGSFLPAEDIMQMMGRCRNVKERHLYVQPNVNGKRETDADILAIKHRTAAYVTGQAAQFDQHGVFTSSLAQEEFTHFISAFLAEENRSFNDLLSHTVALMELEKWQVTFNEDSTTKKVKNMLKKNREIVAAIERATVMTSEAITVEEYEFARAQRIATREIVDGHKRWIIEDTTGQDIEDSYDDFHTPRQRVKLRQFTDLLTARHILAELDRDQADTFVYHGELLHRRSHHTKRAELIESCLCTVFDVNTIRELQNHTHHMTRHEIEVRFQVWKNTLSDDEKTTLPESYFTQTTLLRQLRHIMSDHGLKLAYKRVREGKERHYDYSIDQDHLETWLAYADSRLAHLKKKRKKQKQEEKDLARIKIWLRQFTRGIGQRLETISTALNLPRDKILQLIQKAPDCDCVDLKGTIYCWLK